MRLLFASVIVTAAMGGAHAQGPTQPLPPNTIDCKQFVKTGNEWNEVGTATFDLGPSKDMQMSGSNIPPHAYNIGGFDLYEVLEQKCGRR